MRIRPVDKADAASVNELLVQLGYPQDDTEATATRIQEWAENPAGAAYAAEADGELLGVVAVYVCPFFEHSGSWARIVALVVADHARGQGIGGELVAAAEAFAASHGCERMEVTSSDRRHDAHAFYRSRGYVDQNDGSIRFFHVLGD